MGLPPPGYADAHSWQGVGPITEGCGGNGANGTVVTQGRGVVQPYDDDAQGNGDAPPPAHESIETPLARFVHSSLFQNSTLFVIVLNGFWIGIDVEWNHPTLKKDGKLPLEPLSTVVENLFAIYFTFEIVMRILAFGKYNLMDPTLNRWFVFDSVLVGFMIVETWILLIVEALSGGGGEGILSKFSCLRLMRLTRLTRIMHSLPELLTLVRGMINAARAVGVVLLFMLLIMYVFAIIFTAQIGNPMAEEHFEEEPYWVRDSDPTAVELFGTMFDSIMSLFTRGLLGDNLAETLQAIKDRGGAYSCEGEGDAKECTRTGGELWLMWVFIVFMIISAFCLLNMLVGVLCEVIDETSKEEGEAAQIFELRYNIRASFRNIDESGDDNITKEEWTRMRESADVRHSFERIGVEEEFMDDRLDQIEEHLFGRLDKNHMLDAAGSWMPDMTEAEINGIGPGIPLEEFVAHILEIRPDSPASFLDLEILRTRAERDEVLFLEQLELIENMLLKRMVDVNGCASKVAGAFMLPVRIASKNSEKQREEASELIPIEKEGGVPGDPPVREEEGVSDLPPLALLDDVNLPPLEPLETSIEMKLEEPNNGTSASEAWILGLPIEVLFAELKHRATLQHNSSLPAIDVD